MSSAGVAVFLERALTDEAFQARLNVDPHEVMTQFDLTEDEKAAILSGSAEEVRDLGLDERLSKFVGISFF